jgi:hypothetical protein
MSKTWQHYLRIHNCVENIRSKCVILLEAKCNKQNKEHAQVETSFFLGWNVSRGLCRLLARVGFRGEGGLKCCDGSETIRKAT